MRGLGLSWLSEDWTTFSSPAGLSLGLFTALFLSPTLFKLPKLIMMKLFQLYLQSVFDDFHSLGPFAPLLALYPSLLHLYPFSDNH